MSTTGIPSRLPFRVGTLGATSTSARRRSSATLRPGRAPLPADAVASSPAAGDPRVERRRGRARPRPACSRRRRLPRQAAGTPRRGNRCPFTSWRVPTQTIGSGRAPRAWSGSPGRKNGRVDSAMDDDELRPGDGRRIRVRSDPGCTREIGTTNAASRDLLAQHVAVDVEVRAVRREAVRDPCESVDDEARERRGG